MDNEPDSTLLSDMTEAVTCLPEAVQKPFFKAISDLIGGFVAIPAAKLHQYAQSIEDTTSARKLVAERMAKLAADKVSNDPELSVIAAEMYMPTILRKAKNRVNVAKSAAQHLSSSKEGIEEEKCAAPNDDWMNFFTRFAEDASSERMQDLFGRILAGQVTRPGAFSLTTLRVLSELDQSIAEDFSYAWEQSVGRAVDYSDEWKLGVGFVRWRRLVEAGLMASATSAQLTPEFKPRPPHGLSLWAPVIVDECGLLVYLNEDTEEGWDHIDFTRVGQEIGSILKKPDYVSNMRKMMPKLQLNGVVRIDLFRSGQPNEVLWES